MNFQENKSSFFILELVIDNNKNSKFYKEQLENNVDLILSAMQVSDICYKFDNKNKDNILCCSNTNNCGF